MDTAQRVQRSALRAHDQPAQVAEPSEEPLDLPAASIPPERTAILRLRPLAATAMGRGHLDAYVGQRRIERVSIVRSVTDEAAGQGGDTARVECGRDETDLRAGAAEAAQEIHVARGRPERSARAQLCP